MRQRHKNLARAILLSAQREFRDSVRLFERHAGLMTTQSGAKIKPFMDGQADLYGWITVGGCARHVEIELKVGKDVLSEDQIAWRAVCERSGVAYAVIQCNDVMDGVDNAMKFLRGVQHAV